MAFGSLGATQGGFFLQRELSAEGRDNSFWGVIFEVLIWVELFLRGRGAWMAGDSGVVGEGDENNLDQQLDIISFDSS